MLESISLPASSYKSNDRIIKMSLTVPNIASNAAVTQTLQHNVRLRVGCSP
jgi:hypothetical protein